jgi:hypothetical protein
LESTKIIASDNSCIRRSAQRFRLVNSKVDAEFAALDVELGMLPATWEDSEGAVSWDLDKEAGLWMRFAGCELKDMILTPVERG